MKLVSVWPFLAIITSSFGLTVPSPDSNYRKRPACSIHDLSVRREWGDFSIDERLQYIEAVKCLMSKPSKLPKGVSSAAVNRLDDFVATHINQTLHIHVDGLFLPWHRHFIWLHYQALKNECGYDGDQPYWDWPRHGGNLHESPLFDDSPTSFSGDGIYNASSEPLATPNGTALPQGTGGGCVVTGPFANRTLTFRNFPQILAFQITDGQLPPDALDAAPHCFRRSLNDYILNTYNTQDVVDYMIYQSPNISDLQNVYDFGRPQGLGVHGGGHLSLGPDLGDFFASPNDPAFFLHHGMVDLIWTRWQARRPWDRQYALSGGSTFMNRPPSANVTVDFEMDFGYLGPKVRIGDVMDVRKRPYCYSYDY